MLIGYYKRNFQQKRMTKHSKKHIFYALQHKNRRIFLVGVVKTSYICIANIDISRIRY